MYLRATTTSVASSKKLGEHSYGEVFYMSNSRGWIVTAAGTGINLALGILYTWSIFKADLVSNYGLSNTEAAVPYMVACGIFAIMMVPAGRWQDQMGPRVVAAAGGALAGLGLIVSSFFIPATQVAIPDVGIWGLILGFGVMGGAGIGLGYASATPAAVKWFPPAKKGLIAGIVVSGFGLASVYISPLSAYLLGAFALRKSFLILGIGFVVVAVSLAQLLRNPPEGYIPGAAPTARRIAPTAAPTKNANSVDENELGPGEMLRTHQFYLLWAMYAMTSLAGLMIIGHLKSIAEIQLPGANLGFALVAILAIFNASGRIGAGVLSDTIGRTRTMLLVFVFQAVVVAFFGTLSTPLLLMFGAAAVGFNYGALLSLFPATTSDYFGTKNLGVNYGLVFTAWGVGGVFGGMLGGYVADLTGGYTLAFQIAAGLLALAAALTFATKAPETTPASES